MAFLFPTRKSRASIRSERDEASLVDKTKSASVFSIGLCVLVGLVHLFSSVSGTGCATVPRSLELSQLACAPLSTLFHHGLPHLAANLPPLAVLSFLVALRFGVTGAVLRTLSIAVIGALGVWLFAFAGRHAGASLLVFGFLGAMLSGALSEKGGFFKRFAAVLLGAGALWMYWDILPSLLLLPERISWAGHAWGLAAGGISGGLLFRGGR